MSETLQNTFPLKLAGATPSVQAAVSVLLVEDQPAFVSLLRELFAGNPILEVTLHAADTMAAAEKTLRETGVDLLLLDLTLPDSTGLETVKRARAIAGDRPIVVLTGVEDEELAVAAMQAGAQDYLNKGVDIDVVIRSVRYAIERARNMQALVETERRLKTAQLHLIQAEKLETVGRLAAGVAHEVRNPLAIIQMAVDCLQRRPSHKVEEVADLIEDIRSAVKRAYTISNQLLNFAAPADLLRQPQDLRDIAGNAVYLMRHEIEQRGVRVVTHHEPDLPALLLDRSAMEQVFVNLISNAAYASPRGGTITITTRFEKLDQPGEGVGRRFTDQFRLGQEVVVCDIDDEGPGIVEEDLPRVFDPFFTTKPLGEGTGLGLGIVKNILDLHGGRISLENRPEGGARASIILVP